MNSISAYVSKHSKSSFAEMLKENNIEFYEKNLFPAGTVVNASETIEIIKALGGASVIPALATVLVQWLKNKSSRKIILQTKENEVIHLDGYSVKEIETILQKAKNLTVIQTIPEEDL
jgi:hypothetical protein